MEKIIRIGRKEDTEALRNLWIECFPNDVEYSKFFFERIYRVECARVCEIDGEIAAMLHSFPYDFKTPDGILNARYIYGVGTSKKFRSQGLAGELLRNEARDCDMTVIIPQSESLFDFYKKYSFDELLYVRKKLADAGIKSFRNAEINDIPKLNSMYEEMCRGRIHPVRTEKRWETIIAEFEFLGGGIALFDGGYCAYYENNGSFEISELCAGDGKAPFEYSCPAVTVGDEVRIGAARLISERAKAAFAKNCGRYMNLMHN